MIDIATYQESMDQLLSLYREKKFWQAYDLVNELLDKYPCAVDLLVRRAMIIQLLDNKEGREIPSLDRAKQDLLLACQLAPNATEPFIELGHFEYAVMDDADEGMKHFITAQENADNGMKEALIGQIKCYVDKDELAKAKELLAQARQTYRDDDEIEMLCYELEDDD